ncbi:MAG: putative Ig domain-containing protein [Gaiellaceae bacterium]
MRRGVAAFVALAITGWFAATAQASARANPPQATVIGDSVLTAVEWNPAPLAALTAGIDVRLDVGVCRRLTEVSCPYEGGNVPTLLDVVHQYGAALGTTVLVEVGYNDPAATFADAVEQSIDALLQAGVKRVLWVNLRGFAQQWIDMNAVLDAAAKRHPELTIIDWNTYSTNRWSWFQGDGIHLLYDGAMAMAGFLNEAIRQALAPPPPPPAPPVVVDSKPLPPARVGRVYSTRLVAHGGTGPYTWRIVAGRLPKRLTLRPDGRILGRPKQPGRVGLVVRAVDAQGRAATSNEALTIRRA